MSEFVPTTYCTLYSTWVPQNSYAVQGSEDNETVQATGVPVQILTQRIEQSNAVEYRETTVKLYSGRIRGHVHIEKSWRLLDERNGERYMIDEMDMAQNPLGDDSWFLVLRKVPKKPGQ